LGINMTTFLVSLLGSSLGLAFISEARASACVSIYILDVLQFAISNGNGEKPT
jgi:hypothetical protein